MQHVEEAGDATAIKAALDEAVKAARTLDRTRTQLELEAKEAREHLETVEGKGPEHAVPDLRKAIRRRVRVDRRRLSGEGRRRSTRSSPSSNRSSTRPSASQEKLRDDLEAARSAAKALAATEGPNKLERRRSECCIRCKSNKRIYSVASPRRRPSASRSPSDATARGSVATDFAAKSATVTERRARFAKAAAKVGVEAYAAADHARIRKQEARLAKLAEEAAELRKALAASVGLDQRKSELEAELAEETEKASAAKAALDALGFKPAPSRNSGRRATLPRKRATTSSASTTRPRSRRRSEARR